MLKIVTTYYVGDSTKPADVAKLMNGQRASLLAMDPPYLVDYDGSSHFTGPKPNHGRTKTDYNIGGKHCNEYCGPGGLSGILP